MHCVSWKLGGARLSSLDRRSTRTRKARRSTSPPPPLCADRIAKYGGDSRAMSTVPRRLAVHAVLRAPFGRGPN
uniref:Uncharacterized protein n=1 Tax=Synaphobranchus kaupii TaxID=118154 RepID=A0A9Q1IP66_SYNKA|nr:hypothetical protein SKAU_G00277420 [Synaphobranchus kaupii]